MAKAMPERVLANILIVEDDPQQLWFYSRALRGYRITCVPNASAALGEIERKAPEHGGAPEGNRYKLEGWVLVQHLVTGLHVARCKSVDDSDGENEVRIGVKAHAVERGQVAFRH